MSKRTRIHSNTERITYPYDYENLDRTKVLDSFLVVLNLIQPDHPYFDEQPYPVSHDNVKYGYNEESSPLYASCGPMKNQGKTVYFSSDTSYYNEVDPERIIAINTHEATHITVGYHSYEEHGAHPPRFWRKFGYNAHLILDNWDFVTATYGSVSKEDYIGCIINSEVNSYNIDRRYSDVDHRMHEMARWFENTLKNSN